MTKNGARKIDPPRPTGSLFVVSWRQPLSDQIPVPGVAPNPCSRILERLELEPALRQPDCPAILDQTLTRR